MLSLKQSVCDGCVLREWESLMKTVNISIKFLFSVNVKAPRRGLPMAIDTEVTYVDHFTRSYIK